MKATWLLVNGRWERITWPRARRHPPLRAQFMFSGNTWHVYFWRKR